MVTTSSSSTSSSSMHTPTLPTCKNPSVFHGHLKSADINDLELVAVVYVDTWEGFDGLEPVVEYDIYHKEAFATYQSLVSLNHTVKCQCCGHTLKYQCVVMRKSTNELFPIGRDCAAKLECFQRLGGAMEFSSIALKERALCAKRELRFRSEHPEMVPALDWAKDSDHRIARDLYGKLRQWGLSEKQVWLLGKLFADSSAPQPEKGAAPVGRQTITGVIKSTRTESNHFGMVRKVLVELPNLARVWGNAPSQGEVEVGRKVQFTATFSASDKDKSFGFWSRPAAWVTTAE